MGYCTGSGEASGDHCCYVDGAPCPHLMTNAQALAWINSQSGQGWNNPAKNAARAQVTGVTYLCKIALKVTGLNSVARSNRQTFNQAWAADPEYQATPAPQWRAAEIAASQPVGSLDCWGWQGDPPGTSCCYRRTNAQCDADVAARGVTTTAVNLRKAGGRPD